MTRAEARDAVERLRGSELPDFLTTDELSAYIRVPTGTLRNWRHRGYGPQGFKVGNTVLYRRTVVDAWIAEQERAETASAS